MLETEREGEWEEERDRDLPTSTYDERQASCVALTAYPDCFPLL